MRSDQDKSKHLSKKGLSNNPAGRPKGIPDVRSLHKWVDDETKQKLLDSTIERALAGDNTCLGILINKLYSTPKQSAAPIEFELDASATLSEKANSILEAASKGFIDPETASQLISSIANVGRIIEIDELEKRLEALEQMKNG